MNVINKVETISTDFGEQNEPFDDVEFPEERLLDELPHGSMEGRAILASIFATFDYNRNASRLVDNIIELHETDAKMLDAWHVNGEKKLEHYLTDIGFRYPSRDAHAWATNCEILRNKYSGKWTELLLSVGADAPTLVERLEQDDFLVMKGAKVAPMYARIVDDEVAPLSGVWDLEIPVDTHIRRLSQDLFDAPDMDDDLIRKEWRGLSVEADINRQVIDGALWHIGNKWSDWGEEYWNSL